MSFERKRVVITGVGTFSSAGRNVVETFETMKRGGTGITELNKSDIGLLEDFPVNVGGVIPAEHYEEARRKFEENSLLKENYKEAGLGRIITDTGTIILESAREAIECANLFDEDGEPEVDLDRVSTLIGVGQVDGRSYDKFRRSLEEKRAEGKSGLGRGGAFAVSQIIPDSPSTLISMGYKFHGEASTTTTACASSLTAMKRAYQSIQSGESVAAVTGGGDACITDLFMNAFNGARALSKRGISSPFDVERDGFVMGEGGCVFVFEDLQSALDREAPVYGEIVGANGTSDGYHITSPNPEGEYLMKAFKNSLAQAELSPEDIDLISSHGTSTQLNDGIEAMLYEKLYGHLEKESRPAVIATKGTFGHTLGGAGALGVLGALYSMHREIPVIPGTQSLGDPKSEVDFSLINARLASDPNFKDFQPMATATFSSGFGGKNEVILVISYEQ